MDLHNTIHDNNKTDSGFVDQECQQQERLKRIISLQQKIERKEMLLVTSKYLAELPFCFVLIDVLFTLLIFHKSNISLDELLFIIFIKHCHSPGLHHSSLNWYHHDPSLSSYMPLPIYLWVRLLNKTSSRSSLVTIVAFSNSCLLLQSISFYLLSMLKFIFLNYAILWINIKTDSII